MDFTPYGGVAPSNWTEVSLDDVCTRITDGSHYSPADAPDSPYPMYSVKDMETYGFNPSSCKHISEEDFRKMQKGDCVPLLNDILVAKDGRRYSSAPKRKMKLYYRPSPFLDQI